MERLSHLSLNRQVSHERATWLERTMFGQDRQALALARDDTIRRLPSKLVIPAEVLIHPSRQEAA